MEEDVIRIVVERMDAIRSTELDGENLMERSHRQTRNGKVIRRPNSTNKSTRTDDGQRGCDRRTTDGHGTASNARADLHLRLLYLVRDCL